MATQNALWAPEGISHIGAGEHPTKFTVLATILCGACQRRQGRDAKGQLQHV